VPRSRETAKRNELLFREANEKIAERRDALGALDGFAPFLCECEEEGCTAIVHLTFHEYTQVRCEPHTFVIVPGHLTVGAETDIRGNGWVCVTKEGLL
jgi:hypothetical protein